MSSRYMPFNNWIYDEKGIRVLNFEHMENMLKVFELEYHEWCIENDYDIYDLINHEGDLITNG